MYRLRPAARDDLRGIGRYTSRRWGAEQRRRYVRALYDRFELLAQQPEMGMSVAWLRPGLRRSICGSHVIFYRASDAGLDIVRVLHVSMDFTRHLP